MCGGAITTDELREGRCAHTGKTIDERFRIRDIESFERYFRERTGRQLKKLQRYWFRKLSLGLSFAAVAPTGVGKTFFGTMYSAWLAEEKGKKSYIIVPTTSLLQQIFRQLGKITKNVRILGYLPNMKKSEKEEFRKKLGEGDFDILLTSSAFLSKNFDSMKHLLFDFIFVDDVDAILKASKNVERVLHLLGFTEKEIQSQERTNDSPRGQIMVSTATARPGRKAALFTKLLGFSVGSSRSALRNIDDYFIVVKNEEEKQKVLLRILNALGSGGLVFVSGEAEAKCVALFLSENGIPAAAIVSGISKKEVENEIDRFLEDKTAVLVGVASHYGLLVRGLDYPRRIQYAVFLSIPSFRVSIRDVSEASPRMLLLLASVFRRDKQLESLIPYILTDKVKREKARQRIKEIFEKRQFELRTEDVVVEEQSLIVPDIATYIQASGRTSRLFAGGITKGLAIILDRQEMIEAFRLRASYYDIEVKPSIPIDQLGQKKRELVESREQYARSMEETRDVVYPAVFVVESPTKAKQISRFFGKPAIFFVDEQPFYEVMTENFVLVITASLGHVVDLVERGHYHGIIVEPTRFVPVYGSIKKCRADGAQWVAGEKCPICGKIADDDSARRIRRIALMVRATGMLILATDPDTEGEKIAWDLANLAAGPGIAVRRAEFHEVTRRAITHSLENLREINENRVKAQLVRRIEDRWIGFELSTLLQQHFRERNLSAGRAQSPVLSWIIERYRQYQQKIKHYLLKLSDGWIFLGSEEDLRLRLYRPLHCTVEIVEVQRERSDQTPLPPYSTDTVLRDLNRFLRVGTDEAMRLLQDLFENGLITYHRTDSVRVSDRGLQIARQYLGENFEGRKWSMGEEGAHECIRPTRPVNVHALRDMVYRGAIQVSVPLTLKHFKAYDLIFRRFMASQSPKFQLERVKYLIKVWPVRIEKEEVRTISAKGTALELYPWQIRVDKPLTPGRQQGLLVWTRKSKVDLFTQAEVVTKMRERGIGRPSTFSTLLSKLFTREYVVERKSKLLPTSRGMLVDRFLTKHFADLISEERTRVVQQAMDDVENGKKDYIEVLKEFYREVASVRTRFDKKLKNH